MIDRFAVRSSAQGYGVWDAAVNGWHSARDLDEAEATRIATEMNARARAESRPRATNTTSHAATTPAAASSGPARSRSRTSSSSRRVDPPRRVLVLVDGTWWPGRLDWWVREPDGWFGRATLDSGGPSSWFPAGSLRPAAPT